MTAPDLSEIVYEFAELPKGPTRNGSHSDYRAKAALTRQVRNAARKVIAEQRGARPPAMLPRVKLSYHFFLPTRGRRDWTNLVTAAKPYEDALTPQKEQDGSITLGDIVDDSIAVIDPPVEISWEIRAGRPGFRITITPLTEGLL